MFKFVVEDFICCLTRALFQCCSFFFVCHGTVGWCVLNRRFHTQRSQLSPMNAHTPTQRFRSRRSSQNGRRGKSAQLVAVPTRSLKHTSSMRANRRKETFNSQCASGTDDERSCAETTCEESGSGLTKNGEEMVPRHAEQEKEVVVELRLDSVCCSVF